ncbi:MAG: orc1/cdc6 family replication initiation protein [Methanofastidiosum sp.]
MQLSYNDEEIPLKYDVNTKAKNFSEVSDKDELQYTIASSVEDFVSNKQSSLDDLFDELLLSNSIFKNKEVLRHSYTPDILPHRKNEIEKLAAILVSALKGETPSNIFVYGKTGTGKTVVVKYVGNGLVKKVGGKAFLKTSPTIDCNTGLPKPDLYSNMKMGMPITFIYINCEVVDTQYRLLSKLSEYFGQSVPLTGWPTDKIYDVFSQSLDSEKKLVIIILDEVDQLLKKGGDDVLYNLTRINGDLENARVSIIGISNDLKFIEFLDPRVKSSLGEEEIIFPPYDAPQLMDILEDRSKISFNESVINPGVIPLCAAFAAQEHGDARRALDLLRTAGEIAERQNAKKVTEPHVRVAKDRIEQDRISEVIKTLPTQSKLILYSVYLLEKYMPGEIITGDVFNIYKDLSNILKIDILTQRRVSDLISELDMLGILNAKVVSKGRYGRTREISLGVPPTQIKSLLENDFKIKKISGYIPPIQHRLI